MGFTVGNQGRPWAALTTFASGLRFLHFGLLCLSCSFGKSAEIQKAESQVLVFRRAVLLVFTWRSLNKKVEDWNIIGALTP